MNIIWLGHAAFLITTEEGTRIIMDPYESDAYGGGIGYSPIQETADIVTISHTQHQDHCFTDGIAGDPVILTEAGERSVKGVSIKGIPSFHDKSGGQERGNNLITCLDADGIRLVHMGDLGHLLTAEQVDAVGRPDVLLIPVGGTFTLDAKEATETVNRLNPRQVVPMHFKNTKCNLPIHTVDAFLEGKTNVRRSLGTSLEIRSESMPETTEIVVLDHSL